MNAPPQQQTNEPAQGANNGVNPGALIGYVVFIGGVLFYIYLYCRRGTGPSPSSR